MGASAYATGNSVAFAKTPDLHIAAHEAAHVVQQRGGVQLKGGVGTVGDPYERHADAVADLVVQGKSAEGLLGQMTSASSDGAAVQRQAIQFTIQDDLRAAMAGLGTDKEAIFRRLTAATAAEANMVLANGPLMAELRSELNQSDMSRVLDNLGAPLADKLRLAMDGWGTDEAYIQRSLTSASAAELALVAADAPLVNRLEDELSGEDLRRVLDRLSLPLARKLEYAIRGWGTDEDYVFASVRAASVADVLTVAGNAVLMHQIDDDFSGAELDQWRGLMARRVYDSGNLSLAFTMVMGSDAQRRTRLAQLGSLAVQRTLCELVLATGPDDEAARQAFRSYWDSELPSPPSVAGLGLAALQTLHAQVKLLLDLEKLAEPAFRAQMAAMSKAETEALLANVAWFNQARLAPLLSRIKNERLVSSAEGLTGQLYWAGGSGPDPGDHYQIRTTTDRPTDGAMIAGPTAGTMETNTNEFATWVRGGVEPTTISKMNCWEMVLFAGYQAGVIPKAWIIRIHTDAATAGEAAASEASYYTVLSDALQFGSATSWISGTVVPRGNLVFFNGLDHVALSTGNVVGGQQEIMSLWVLPGMAGGLLNSVTQRTTIEALVATTVVDASLVRHGPNPWR
jgi:cell wall-associated NlpC family hydrolase